MKTIILSCAHGSEVAGKRSPDGRHREYKWSRDRQYEIADKLKARGINVELVPARGIDTEPGLSARVQIENKIKQPAFVFSLHNNAAGGGTLWMTARGVEIWTTRGNTKSDAYATKIFTALQAAMGDDVKQWRKDSSDGDIDKEANFTELMSVHPAVLLEWLFQDNKDDVELLQNPTINTKFVNCITDVLYDIAIEG